jgi:hypothetical protein
MGRKMAEVATTKLFENERVIVWEMILEPGESTGFHTHHHTYFFHAIECSTMEVTDTDGNVVATHNLGKDSVKYFDLKGDELIGDQAQIPSTHSAKNIGTTRYREILVELK